MKKQISDAVFKKMQDISFKHKYRSHEYKKFLIARDLAATKWLFLTVAQLVLLTFLGYETLTSDETIQAFKEPPTSSSIVLTRLVCAVFLHIILASEVKQGFNMMKYANNHWWLFDSWSAAYVTGLMQMLIVVLLELINIALLLTNASVQDIIQNFTALVIVVEFDNNLFHYANDDAKLARLLEDRQF